MDDNTKSNVKWSIEDEAKLVCALKKARDQGKWGDNNPKKPAWSVCVAALEGSEKISGGAAKEAGAVGRRWQHLRAHHISCVVCTLTTLLQLKQEYVIFKHIRSQSGWGWDNEKGTPDVSDDVWKEFKKVSPQSHVYNVN